MTLHLPVQLLICVTVDENYNHSIKMDEGIKKVRKKLYC